HCITMALGLFVIPLLVFGFPYFPLAALSTSERPVEIKIGKASVGIHVRKLAVIGWRSRGMTFLLCWGQAQHPFCFAQLFVSWIAACINLLTHLLAGERLSLATAATRRVDCNRDGPPFAGAICLNVSLWFVCHTVQFYSHQGRGHTRTR